MVSLVVSLVGVVALVGLVSLVVFLVGIVSLVGLVSLVVSSVDVVYLVVTLVGVVSLVVSSVVSVAGVAGAFFRQRPGLVDGSPCFALIQCLLLSPVKQSPPAKVSPLIENSSTQLQYSQASIQGQRPLAFTVGQCQRETNSHCAISVDTSSENVGKNVSFNACCHFGKGLNLTKKYDHF